MKWQSFFTQKKEFFVSLGIWVGLLIGLLIAYWPAVSSLYAYHDSLNYFLDTDQRFVPPGTFFAFATGRYLAAVFLVLIGRSVDSLQDLQVVRFLSVLQLSLCGILIINWLRRNFLTLLESFLSVMILFTLPPFQVVVCHAGPSFYPISILFSLWSFFVCFKAQQKPKRLRRVAYVFSVFLLTVSLAVFPPGGMFFWSMMAVFILFSHKSSQKNVYARCFRMLSVGFAGMVVYRILLELSRAFYLSFNIAEYSPYAVSLNLWQKVAWYISDPVVKILNFWNIMPSSVIAVGSAGLLLGALVIKLLQYRRSQDQGVTCSNINACTLLLFALFFLTSAPNLIYADNVSAYRCYMALAAFFVFLLLWALRQYAACISSARIRGNVIAVILCVLACSGVWCARQTIWRYRVRVSAEEFRFFQEALQSVDLNHYERIYVVQPSQERLFVSGDEYGGLTTYFKPDIIGFFALGIRTLIRDNFSVYHILYSPETGKTMFLLKNFKAQDPELSYRVALSYGFDARNPSDFVEPTLVIDMNRVVDSLLAQDRRQDF